MDYPWEMNILNMNMGNGNKYLPFHFIVKQCHHKCCFILAFDWWMPCWARCSFSSFSGLTFCGIIILPLVMSTMLMVTSHRLTVKLAFSVLVEKPRCSLLNGISSGCIIGMQQHLCAPLVRSSALFKNEIKKKENYRHKLSCSRKTRWSVGDRRTLSWRGQLWAVTAMHLSQQSKVYMGVTPQTARGLSAPLITDIDLLVQVWGDNKDKLCDISIKSGLYV